MVGKKVLGWRKGVSNDGLERILNGLRKFPIDFFLFLPISILLLPRFVVECTRVLLRLALV